MINKQSALLGAYRSFLHTMYGKCQSNTGRLEMMKEIEDFLSAPANKLINEPQNLSQ